MEPGSSSSKKTLTNWLDLPRDLTIEIFIKIGVIHLLCSAQSVCSSWRAIARDPRLYRVINIHDFWNYFDFHDENNYDLVVKLATEAIHRSRGQAIEFSIGGPEYPVKEEILYRLMFKTPRLMCLRLSSCCCISEFSMTEVIPKLPLLEEVEFCNCYFEEEVIQVLGRSCPNLKSFRLNNNCETYKYEDELFNDEAFAIAGNLNPSLRSLDLFGDLMTNTGLEAILDRFSQLEYLDLRQCFNIDLNGDLLKRCQRIKTLRLPNELVLSTQYEDGDSNYSHGDSDE